MEGGREREREKWAVSIFLLDCRNDDDDNNRGDIKRGREGEEEGEAFEQRAGTSGIPDPTLVKHRIRLTFRC